MHQLAKPPRQPPTATSVMLAISAAVKQAFVRIERAGEALVGHVGPFFVAIYVGLVGTGMWIFFVCILPERIVVPNALKELLCINSPFHLALAFPGALASSMLQEPASMLCCVASSFILFYIALMMIWSYYMACTVSPGTVEDGLSKTFSENRLGPGSTQWWRTHYQQAASAANLVCYKDDMSWEKTDTLKELDLFEQDLTTRYRFCKKCARITMETALSLLPPDLRAREKMNRRAHFLHMRHLDAAKSESDGVKQSPMPQGLFEDMEDEGKADIRAWLGQEEADQLVLPPKPERAHHCRTCKTCILKYDHHCPWINQCVGLGNERYFILFMLWFGLGTMIYSYMGWNLAYRAFRHPRTWSSTHVPRILYLLIWVKALVMGLAVISFAVWHLRMIARGETSVENQDHGMYKWLTKEHYSRSAKQRHQSFVNVYSLGWRRNFQVFFNCGPGMTYSYYTLLLPLKIEPYSDGWHWAKRAGLHGSHGGIAPEEEFTDDEGDQAEAS